MSGNIMLTHLHVSNCRVASRLAFFVARLVGNGVITVMIKRLQQNDDADNQSGDNRQDCSYINLSDRSPASLNFALLSALCSN